VLDSTV